MAALLLGVLWGCKKEENASYQHTEKSNIIKDPKLFEDAKSYFTQKFGETNNIQAQTSVLSGGDDVFASLSITPEWSEAVITPYLKKYPILLVPVKSIKNLDGVTTSYNLAFFRDSTGRIQAKLNVSVPDSTYAASHANFDVKDFSGCFFQIDMGGHLQNLLRIKDGIFIKKGEFVQKNNLKSSTLQVREDCEDDGGPDCPPPSGRKKSWLRVVLDGFGGAASWVYTNLIQGGVASGTSIGNLIIGGSDYYDNSNTSGNSSSSTGSQPNAAYLADEVGNEFFDLTEERATLLYINVRLKMTIPEIQLLRDNRCVTLQIQDYLMGHDNTQGHIYAKVHLSLLTENPDYNIYNQQSGCPVSIINTLGRYVNLGFSGQEFGIVILNSSLYAQVDSKIDKPDFMHGEGWTLGQTCGETFLYVKVGEGFTTNVKEVSHGYLKYFSYFYYCIPNMCVQVSGKDQFGQPLTAQKASELSAYAMDNARLEIMEDIGSLIRTNEEAKQLFKTYFQEELSKLTGGRTSCSISYGSCSGNNIPGEFVYMKSILTAMNCIQVRCH